MRSISGRAREILAVEIKKIEQEEHEAGGVAGVGRQLDHAERGDAVGAHAAQFAVEIGLARGKRGDGPGDLRIFGGPVEPVAGQQPHLAMVEPGMHAEAVIFDFMQPLVAVRRRFARAASVAAVSSPAERRPRRGRRATGCAMPGAGRGFVRRGMGLATPR